MSEIVARLETEYCPPLDPALLVAILSDFDLQNLNQIKDARSTLDQLKDTALIEEESTFDATGAASGRHPTGYQGEISESGSDAVRSRSHETDLTSLSNGLSSVDLSANEDEVYDTSSGPAQDLEKLDFETKLNLLDEVLGHQVSKYSIKHTLNKCNGKWHMAMEELLNHVYFAGSTSDENEPPVQIKGVDAFFSDEGQQKKKKPKSKARNRRPVTPLSGAADYDQSGQTTSNIWSNSNRDIDFLSSRLRIPSSTISSAYHAHGASIPKTLGALLKASMEESKNIVPDDADITTSAQELHGEFPSINSDYILTIIRLTYPSTATAHELAHALTKKDTPAGGLQVIPHYTPIEHIIASENTPPRSASHSKPSSNITVVDLEADPLLRANSYAAMRSTAFAQAHAAHRRARSDRLMGGAASYYSDLARQTSSLHASASSAAYDRLVNSQSTPSSIDLHGVDVLNAVRISRQRVTTWWTNAAENRGWGRIGAEGRQKGFAIVVGAGTHSVGGKGRLGPAVSKALKQDGWKVEWNGPVVLVTGKEK